MATALARMLGWCLGAVLLTGCINLDRNAPGGPDDVATMGAEVATEDVVSDVVSDTIIDDAVEVAADDLVQIEATIVGVDAETSADAPDGVQVDAIQVDGEVIGTEVIAADVQPPDATEVTTCGADHCLIEGTCYDKGATDPADPTGRICNPMCSQTAWVPDCSALGCVEDPYCDGGNCYSPEDVTHACFVPSENRCYAAGEQTEGVDWPDAPEDPWPNLARNTVHQASINPLGADPNGNNEGDVDWLRWGVTPDPSAIAAGVGSKASARITNYTGANIELCVLVSCGQGAVADPLAVTCSEGATPFPRVDATREGCCLKVSPEGDKRAQTVWARPTCVLGVTQQTGFARVAAPGGDGGACGRYELAFDIDVQDGNAP